MSCRHRYTLLPILLSVFAPLGCTRWQCGFPQMMMPTHLIGTANNAPAPAGNVSGEIDAGQSAQLCLEAGTALEKKGYVTEAIQQYENARAQDAQAKVARRLAVLYDKQGDAQRAEAEYLRALQEQSGDAELLNDFGYFHLRHDHLQVAENWLRNATTINPNLQCAWINLGQVLARQGRIEESYQAFAHVLRPAEAYSNLGVLLAKQGRTVEARSALQQAISLDPSLEQPQAFLKALPPTPALLPPGITKNTPPAPPSAKSAPAMLTSTKPTTTAKTETPRSTPKVQSEPANIAASAMKVSSAPATKPALKPEPAVLPVSAAQKQTPSISDSNKTSSHKDSGSADEPIILHGPVRPLPVIITKKQPAKASDDLPTIINKRTSASEAFSPASASPPSGESTHKQSKEASTTTPRMLPAPPLPPPPPPPAPAVSRSLSSAIRESDAPIVRTAAWSVAQSEQKTSLVPSLKPLPLVLPTPPPVKMLPVANTKPAPSRKPAPQATLTDCYGEIEIKEMPQK